MRRSRRARRLASALLDEELPAAEVAPVVAAGIQIALEASEVGAHVGGALVAQVAVLLQRLADDSIQLGGRIGIEARAGRRARSRIALKISAELPPRNASVLVAIS